MKTLIKNGLVVLENKAEQCDILIEGSKIVRIGKNLDIAAEDNVIDAAGKTVMAGFIDMHCHLREPGYEYKEDILSGTKSALQGGFTTVCCMPNTSPPADNAAIIKYIAYRAAEVDNAKVLPIGCITKGQRGEELAEMGKMCEAGAIAVSDDGRPVSNGNVMRSALEYAASRNILVICHSEDLSIADGGVVNEGLNSTISGLKGINRVAEEAGIARDVLLAESVGARVHIAHVSTKNSVDLIRSAKARGVKVTCETCPHYFTATDSEILSYNTNAKINPPLRTDEDVLAVIEGIKDGTIDVIATDHAPHAADEKNAEFNLAPFGTVGFETAFSLGLTHLVNEDVIDLCKLSRLMSAKPAEILGIGGGKLAENERADIVIIDTEKQYTVEAARLASKSKNSLFLGWVLSGVVENVFVNGEEKEIKSYDR